MSEIDLVTDTLEDISSEDEWHQFLIQGLEAAGWHVKHEVQANDSRRRCDLLCYHSEYNTSFSDAEWLGIEAKYSDGGRFARAVQAAQQIDERYIDASWLSSGEHVKLWAVAPYCADSHRGSGEEYIAARGHELGAAEVITHMGIGYLLSWHPRPGFVFNNWMLPDSVFPEKEAWTPGIPAFVSNSRYKPRTHEDEGSCQREAALANIKRSTQRFTVDNERYYQRQRELMGERGEGDE